MRCAGGGANGDGTPAARRNGTEVAARTGSASGETGRRGIVEVDALHDYGACHRHLNTRVQEHATAVQRNRMARILEHQVLAHGRTRAVEPRRERRDE